MRRACGISFHWTVLCWSFALSLWVACESTETGNPPRALDAPVLTDSLMRVQPFGSNLAIVGEVGAVLPGGSTVEIFERGRRLARVETNPDGSFQITLHDVSGAELLIRATNELGSTEQTLPLPAPELPDPIEADASSGLDGPRDAGVIVDSPDTDVVDQTAEGGVVDSATQPSVEAEALSCEELSSSASQALNNAFASADRSCEQDRDCVPLQAIVTTSCLLVCEGAISVSALASVEAAAERVNQQQCAAFSRANCGPPRACKVAPQVPKCQSGMCVAASANEIDACIAGGPCTLAPGPSVLSVDRK